MGHDDGRSDEREREGEREDRKREREGENPLTVCPMSRISTWPDLLMKNKETKSKNQL